jgi:hypothetical protein
LETTFWFCHALLHWPILPMKSNPFFPIIVPNAMSLTGRC